MQATRRVVTGHDEQGKAVVLFDGPAPNMKTRRGGNVLTMLWVTDESPTDMAGTADRADRQIGVPPPPNGTIFRVVEFAPLAGEAPAVDHDAMLREMGIDPATQGYARHAFTHRTKSIDYAIVLDGEIDMLLDDTQGACQGRRLSGAAGHQPRLGEQQRQALPYRFYPDRRQRAGSVEEANRREAVDRGIL